jgi:hypothetical protein
MFGSRSFIHKIWLADTCRRRTKCLRNPAVSMCNFVSLWLERRNLLNGISIRNTLLDVMGICGSSLTDVVLRTAIRIWTWSPYLILSESFSAREILIPGNVVRLVCVHLRSRPTVSSSKNAYNLNEVHTWLCTNTFLRYLGSNPVTIMFARITHFEIGAKCFVELDSVRK